MNPFIFDFDSGSFAHSISDSMAIDPDGDLLMRTGDHTALNLNTGELHITSFWPENDDDD